MSKPLTVKELAKLCQEEIKKGDHTIMLSDDDGGNGYHKTAGGYHWHYVERRIKNENS